MMSQLLDLAGLTKTVFNATFIIRYYEDQKNRSNHKLIGIDTFEELVGNRDKALRLLNRALNNPKMRTVCKLRRGCEFIFIQR